MHHPTVKKQLKIVTNPQINRHYKLLQLNKYNSRQQDIDAPKERV